GTQGSREATMIDERNPPKAGGVIVLLGNENDAAGNLSNFALARCSKAADLATRFPEYPILPTGNFGRFNRSDRAHGDLLREHLIALGVASQRVLIPTDSSNTLEDALVARKRVIDLGATALIVVTSEFHMRRVKYIFHRVFPDLSLNFEKSDEASLQ